MTTREDSISLLNATHDFPCPVIIKAIGKNAGDFPQRVVRGVRKQLQLEIDPPFQIREASGGRHIAVTLEPIFESAEQVLEAYEVIRTMEGVVMVM